MKPIYIVYAKRTPIGKLGGSLAPVRVDDLMALLIKDSMKILEFDPLLIDDVIIGCANQAGEDNRNLGRMSVLLGELPKKVPGTTINRLCGSSLDAVMGASARIGAGMADCILAGGAESMTRGPWVMGKSGRPYGRDCKMYDTTFGWRFPNPKMEAMFPLYSMGETAEEIGKFYHISRQDQDAFALDSHHKALKAHQEGRFKKELLPIDVPLKKNRYTVDKDEGPREDTDLKALAKLPAIFRKGGTVTAGNSSQMSDGAALTAVVSEDFLKKHNLTPMAEITGCAVYGVEPSTMGLGPIAAVKHLCKKFDLKTDGFDVVELNEAFAIQALACIKELDLDLAKVNLNGGAISLGHPLGCSGARILTTLVHLMSDNPNYKQGLATMCIGVGQGIAVSIKNSSG